MQNRRFFPRVLRTSEDQPPSQAFLKGARISFLPTAVFYVKVRLIYKLCCYLVIFVSLKAATYLYQCSKVQLLGGTKYELPKNACVALEAKRRQAQGKPATRHLPFPFSLASTKEMETYTRRLARGRRGV